jgi:hypothetical protein
MECVNTTEILNGSICHAQPEAESERSVSMSLHGPTDEGERECLQHRYQKNP